MIHITILYNVLVDYSQHITPNGDGINDYWQINDLAAYLGALVRIFNRYRQQVYWSVGYSIPWDGTYKGSPIPVGTFYYIILLRWAAQLKYIQDT